MSDSILSEENVEAAVQLFHHGAVADAIADIFGVTGRAIQYRLARRGLHYRRKARREVQLAFEVRRGLIWRLVGQNPSLALLSAHVRLRPRSLRAWMARRMPDIYERLKATWKAQRAARRRTGPARPQRTAGPKPLTRSRRARIKSLYLAGCSVTEIAARYRHSRTAIWRLLRAMAVPMRPRGRRPGAE